MIVLDASVVIGYLDRTEPLHQRSHDLLAREIEDDFAVSTVTLAEVLVGPVRSDRLAEAQQALADLEVVEVPFAAGSAAELAELRSATGLKLPDCCVLLAAHQQSARVASFDRKLLTAAAARGLDVAGG